MKKIVSLIVIACSAFAVSAQDCKGGQFKQGLTYTTTSYDKKDKVQGSNKATCTSVTTSGDATVANMKNEGFDKDGKSTGTSEFTITCKKGAIYIDMRTMTAGSTEAFKDATMTMEGDNLEMPQTMTPGQTLPDANVKMTFTKDGAQVGTMDMVIKNRKVESKESMTTSAGTYECYKISYEVETKMFMAMGTMTMPGPKMTVRAVVWYNFDAGAVRSESYRGDKLMGYSLLTEIKTN